MNDRNHSFAKDSGLTIAELVVSMGILAFIALSVATMVSTSVHLDKLAQERSIATSLASGRIMRITSMPFQIIGEVGRYGLLEETLAVGPPPTFTTAYGLIVAFVTQPFYNYFISKASAYTREIETAANILFETLDEMERMGSSARQG